MTPKHIDLKNVNEIVSTLKSLKKGESVVYWVGKFASLAAPPVGTEGHSIRTVTRELLENNEITCCHRVLARPTRLGGYTLYEYIAIGTKKR